MALLAHVTGLEFVELLGFYLAGVATGLSIGYAALRRLNPPRDE